MQEPTRRICQDSNLSLADPAPQNSNVQPSFGIHEGLAIGLSTDTKVHGCSVS